jgi:hypothetical protein
MNDKLEYLLKYAFGVVVLLGSFYMQHEGKISEAVFGTIIAGVLAFIAKMEYDQKQALKDK